MVVLSERIHESREFKDLSPLSRELLPSVSQVSDRIRETLLTETPIPADDCVTTSEYQLLFQEPPPDQGNRRD